MRKTQTKSSMVEQPLTVDVKGLMKLLSCGEQTARNIGENAKARVPTGSKRVLYSVAKVQAYLESNTF